MYAASGTNTRARLLSIGIGLSLAACGASSANGQQRAKPPQWAPGAMDPFFEDARKALDGKRPAGRQQHAKPADDAEAPATSADPTLGAGALGDWSRLAEPDSLAAEVVRLSGELRAPLSSPARFKSGGYRDCRARFNALAVLLAVVAQYDGDIRWQADAAGMRDALARAAASCTVGSDESYAAALQRQAELEDLIRGQPLGLRASAAVDDWRTLADRQLLMHFMEAALEERIAPALDSQQSLSKRSAAVQHDAQILAVLATVIRAPGFDNWDDEPFQEHAGALQDAAAALNRAAGEVNHERARAALNRAVQSCTDCHAAYRG